jgi:hypothetical protein
MIGIIGPAAGAIQVADIRWFQHQSGGLGDGRCSAVEMIQTGQNQIPFIRQGYRPDFPVLALGKEVQSGLEYQPKQLSKAKLIFRFHSGSRDKK